MTKKNNEYEIRIFIVEVGAIFFLPGQSSCRPPIRYPAVPLMIHLANVMILVCD